MTAHARRIHVHTSRQAIRWGDMDALAHVNNTVYFRYMEQARVEWLQSQHAEGGIYGGGQGSVIVNASCTFLEPMVYPGEFEVRMFLAEPGRSSVGSYYEIWLGERKCAEGAAKIVWIDLVTGRPTLLPERIAAALRSSGDGGRGATSR